MAERFGPAAAYEAWYDQPKGKLVDRLEKEVIAELCRIQPGQKVLEIGCGTGHFARYFRELGAEVTGLDTSPEMLHLAQDENGGCRVDLRAGDAYRLPFADRSFDLVAMITTLEFMASPQQVLAEAFRVSRGRVFLGILNRHSLLAWRRKRSGKTLWREARFYTLPEVAALLGRDKKIKWRGAVYWPLINSGWLAGLRLSAERWLSAWRCPGGAFIGALAESQGVG